MDNVVSTTDTSLQVPETLGGLIYVINITLVANDVETFEGLNKEAKQRLIARIKSFMELRKYRMNEIAPYLDGYEIDLERLEDQ